MCKHVVLLRIYNLTLLARITTACHHLGGAPALYCICWRCCTWQGKTSGIRSMIKTLHQGGSPCPNTTALKQAGSSQLHVINRRVSTSYCRILTKVVSISFFFVLFFLPPWILPNNRSSHPAGRLMRWNLDFVILIILFVSCFEKTTSCLTPIGQLCCCHHDSPTDGRTEAPGRLCSLTWPLVHLLIPANCHLLGITYGCVCLRLVHRCVCHSCCFTLCWCAWILVLL